MIATSFIPRLFLLSFVLAVSACSGRGGGSSAAGGIEGGAEDGADAAEFSILTSGLASGSVSMPYAETVLATSGFESYEWSVTEGSLPPGLEIETNTRSSSTTISGTPTSAGTFSFTIRAGAAGRNASRPFLLDVAELAVQSDGWTEFTPQPGALTIYASSSGDDSWPGTQAQPKRTLAGGFAALREGEPDWLLLKRGDTFPLDSSFAWTKTGPAASQAGWMRLGAWGNESDPRPILDSGSASGLVITPGFMSSRNTQNIAITDVHLLASMRRNDPAGVTSTSHGIQTVAASWQGSGYAFSNILIENALFEGHGAGFVASHDIANLSIRRCIFHYIFHPDTVNGATNGALAVPNGWLLEENIFYRIQSHDIPGVVQSAYSLFAHSVYAPSHASNVVSRGNIVVRATEALMQRAGGVYRRNVGAHCRVAGLIGQTWGPPPTPGGVQATFEESLLLNSTEQPFQFGNTASGTVRENLLVRDLDGTTDFNLMLWPQSTTETGTNIGVHNVAFTNNHLSGRIAWNPADTTSYSGLSFSGNAENMGVTPTGIGEYLASIGWSGSDIDDWAGRLIMRDRYNYSSNFESSSIINFYRERVGMAPLD